MSPPLRNIEELEEDDEEEVVAVVLPVPADGDVLGEISKELVESPAESEPVEEIRPFVALAKAVVPDSVEFGSVTSASWYVVQTV